MPTEQLPPVVLALTASDHGYQDPSTGKFFILGTISVINAPDFPCSLQTFCVYAALTDGRGQTQVKFRLVDVDEVRAPLIDADASVLFPDPITVAEILFVIGGLTFPEPGEYRLQLLSSGGEILCERRLLANQVQPPGLSPAGEPPDAPT